MKIVLLASNPQLFSNKRLIEAAKARGHSIKFINIEHCYMNICARKPEIHYQKGKSLKKIDAVIPRIKPSVTFYGTAVLRQFELMGAYCLNSALSISKSRDKLKALQILAQKKIDIPTTGFAHAPRNTKDVIQLVGGAPLIIKLLEGTQGKGVVLAETQKASESVISAFKLLNANILVQEFIKESAGVDLRCFVVGDKVVGAVERRSSDGDFRSNVHLGGTAHQVKITPKERKIAVLAAKAMGLQVAGVDIIKSNDGPKILEVNSSPGVEGIEKATGIDIATLMIKHIEKQVAERNKEKKLNPLTRS
jgi:ribosomal protein S6--L-glutamate ligase